MKSERCGSKLRHQQHLGAFACCQIAMEEFIGDYPGFVQQVGAG